MTFSSDQALMQKIHQHDDHAFGQFVGRHKDMLVDYCFQMTGEPGLAHDIALAIFVDLHNAGPARAALADPVRWLVRVATAKIQSAERKKKGRKFFRSTPATVQLPRFEPGISPGDGSPGWQQMMREETVRSALAMLPLDYRQLLALREIMGLGVHHVAALTGDTAAGVNDKTHRAHQALASALQTMGEM